MKWFLYIVRCKDRSLYTGIALDVKRRLREHSEGKGSRYLRGKAPLRLVYTETFPNRSKASKREAQIKRWPRKKKLALIKNV